MANVSIADKQKSLDVLMTSAYMRNLFHNNGTHKSKYPFSTKLDGLSYDFETGKQAKCISWEHICTALEKGLDAVDEIFAAPEVTGLASV